MKIRMKKRPIVRKKVNKTILFTVPIYFFRRLERMRDEVERSASCNVSIRSLIRLALADLVTRHESESKEAGGNDEDEDEDED